MTYEKIKGATSSIAIVTAAIVSTVLIARAYNHGLETSARDTERHIVQDELADSRYLSIQKQLTEIEEQASDIRPKEVLDELIETKRLMSQGFDEIRSAIPDMKK